MSRLSPRVEQSNHLAGVDSGLYFRYPVTQSNSPSTPLDLTWDITYRWYDDALIFRGQQGLTTAIEDEWRFSIALARRDGPFVSAGCVLSTLDCRIA
ncbi:MAG: hypothetical protein AAGH65_01005 [Pseudomonadota bacterium]